MKRCLRFQLRALFSLWRLFLLPPALGLLLGWEAAAALSSYTARWGTPEPAATLALALDMRHFVPLAGAAWAAAYFGAVFDARSAALPLSRGYGRFAVFGGALLLFFSGCAVISLLAQVFSLLPVLYLLRALPAAWLPGFFALRLLLDLGMAAPCAAVAAFAGENLYGRALVFLYGLLLWRLLGSHLDLWLPAAAQGPGLAALWPLPALLLSLGCCAPALRRKEL
jgi:hypothetical protein